MGYIVGMEERRVYVSDKDGSIWESEHKKQKLADSMDELMAKEAKAAEPPMPEAEKPDVVAPSSSVEEKKEELVDDMLAGEKGPDGDECRCDVCGFQAKSPMGLRIHALTHKRQKGDN